jgi:hypothetical protein
MRRRSWIAALALLAGSVCAQAQETAGVASQARWGNWRRPGMVAETHPPTEYTLVGVPDGIVQSEWAEEFRTTISNAEQADDLPLACLPGVDLFRPDGLAPVGVYGDHTLDVGRFFAAYRYSIVGFGDLHDGTGAVSTAQTLGSFTLAPTHSTVQKHTALIEYAPTQDLTILGMLPYYDIQMTYVGAAGVTAASTTTDPGDVSAQALYVLHRDDCRQIHLNLGMSFPTGVLSTDRVPPTFDSPDGSYWMRTSSGTYDLRPGLTYRGQSTDWTWGAQALGTIRLGLGHFDYKLGDRVDLTAWLARKWGDHVSTSVRLDGQFWGDIRGADLRLNQLLVPTNRPDLYGGRRLDLLFGVNLFLPMEHVPGQWLSVEAGFPLAQSLNGPQPATDWLLTAGWNVQF